MANCPAPIPSGAGPKYKIIIFKKFIGLVFIFIIYKIIEIKIKKFIVLIFIFIISKGFK